MAVSVKGSGNGGLSSSDVTASSAQVLAGYTALTTDSNDETKQGTIQSLEATTYNTSNVDQTIESGKYLGGQQVFKAVTTSNISAENIKSGTIVQVGDSNSAGRIVNVTGTFTSDADAIASNLISGKTAYVNGAKITGTMTQYDGTIIYS